MGRVERKSVFNGLQARIAILLSIAVLPLGLIAVLQTQRAVEAAESALRDALSAQTTKAAQPERDAILSAFALAEGLASAVAVTGLAGPDCTAVVRQASEREPKYGFIGIVDRQGRSECSNYDEAFDFWAGLPAAEVERLVNRPKPDVVFSPAGRITERPVIIVSLPMLNPDETLEGFVALSFFVSDLDVLRRDLQFDQDVALVTFNADGVVLTSDASADDDPPWMPADLLLSDLVGSAALTFSARAEAGDMRDYALVPIVENRAYALGTWRAIPSVDYPLTTTILLPVTIWAITLSIALWALGRQVVKPIQKLRMHMQSFADGRTIFRNGDHDDTPNELREIGAAFETMAEKILHDEADMEDQLREREMLLREVHHRVKNNLQLMSSIINMQIRQSEGTEAEAALKGVHGRLSSLAKFHQDLYQTSSLSKLRADRLIQDLARQIFSIGSAQATAIDLQMDLDEIVLSPDQTSPLAMLTTEALTNTLKYASANPGKPKFAKLSFKIDDPASDMVRLEIVNSVTSDTEGTPNGLGSRLIAAFASQLEAAVEHRREPELYSLSVVFKRSPTTERAEGTPESAEAL